MYNNCFIGLSKCINRLTRLTFLCMVVSRRFLPEVLIFSVNNKKCVSISHKKYKIINIIGGELMVTILQKYDFL